MSQSEYQHSITCSGSGRNPRTPGNSCSCHSYDLEGNRLDLLRHDDQIKRTIRVAMCPGCHKRTEFPLANDFPKEVFCIECTLWAPVEELSWDGKDFAKLLPVFERP